MDWKCWSPYCCLLSNFDMKEFKSSLVMLILIFVAFFSSSSSWSFQFCGYYNGQLKCLWSIKVVANNQLLKLQIFKNLNILQYSNTLVIMCEKIYFTVISCIYIIVIYLCYTSCHSTFKQLIEICIPTCTHSHHTMVMETSKMWSSFEPISIITHFYTGKSKPSYLLASVIFCLLQNISS